MDNNQRAVDLLVNDMDRTHRDLEATAHRADPRVASFALSYMDAFGYLKDELVSWKDISLDDIRLALGDLQGMLGLKKTKTLTVQTVRGMEAPRCGCPDVLRSRHTCQKAMHSGKRKTFSYVVLGRPTGLDTKEFDDAIDLGFVVWESFGAVHAKRVMSKRAADIWIDVGHGPQSNFDGPGGTLGWSMMQSDGKLLMKLDADERWVFNPKESGICIHNVIRHEIGHLFGLTHSRIGGALMAPFYNESVSVPQIDDDIKRFQAQHGANEE